MTQSILEPILGIQSVTYTRVYTVIIIRRQMKIVIRIGNVETKTDNIILNKVQLISINLNKISM